MARFLKRSDKVRLHNATTLDITWGTVNFGVWQQTGTIRPGAYHAVKVDRNVTYREYWFAVLRDNAERVILTSEDLMDWEAISIYMTSDHSFSWRGTTWRGALLPTPQVRISAFTPLYQMHVQCSTSQ